MKNLLKFITLFLFLTNFHIAHGKEVQFNCTYQSGVRLLNADQKSPTTSSIAEKNEYIFFINDEKNDSTYLNLKYKVKSKLKVALLNSNLVTVVEDINADNHFSVTIFFEPNQKEIFPTVMYLHSWNPSIPSHYLPKMELGTCQKIS
jgi:hypothetical protein